MAAGPEIIGAAAFVAIKFAGYRYAGIVLNRHYKDLPAVSPNIFGVARTCLGFVAGVSLTFAVAQWNFSHQEPMWYLLLFPVRLAEWLLIIGLFYERRCTNIGWLRLLKASFYGSLWSYALDIPAALSVFVMPGGMWIC